MTWDPMWIRASSQGTSFPFIQILSDFGKDMSPTSSWRRLEKSPDSTDSSPPSGRCQRNVMGKCLRGGALSSWGGFTSPPPDPPLAARGLLRLAAERTSVRASVEGLAAVPAEALFRHIPGLEPLADVLELGGVVVDVGGGGEVLQQLRGMLVARGDLRGQRLHHDVRDLAGDL